MRKEWLWALALAFLLSSTALGWMAWERGEVDLYIFLFIPVLKADGAYGAAAMLLAFASLVVIVLSLWIGSNKDGPEGRASVGGVIMIGPVPIVMGVDRQTIIITLVLSLIALMIMVLLLVQ